MWVRVWVHEYSNASNSNNNNKLSCFLSASVSLSRPLQLTHSPWLSRSISQRISLFPSAVFSFSCNFHWTDIKRHYAAVIEIYMCIDADTDRQLKILRYALYELYINAQLHLIASNKKCIQKFNCCCCCWLNKVSCRVFHSFLFLEMGKFILSSSTSFLSFRFSDLPISLSLLVSLPLSRSIYLYYY